MKTHVTVLVLLLGLFALPSVFAHADFVTSEPPPGARLAQTPNTVRVILSQDADPAGSSLLVTNHTGARVDAGDFVVEPGDQPTFTVSLAPGLGDGAYRVAWKALSRIDHHTTQGTFGFAVGNFTPPEETRAASGAPTIPGMLGRSTFFLGLFLAAGSILFGLFVAPQISGTFLRELDRLAWPLILTGSLTLLADAVSRTGLEPSEWLSSAVLADLLLRTGVAAGVTIAAAFQRISAARRGALSLGLVLLAFFSARSGHASSSGPVWIGVDTVHFVSTALWVGGLVVFAIVLLAHKRVAIPDHDLAGIGHRFSRAALVALIMMAVTGILLSIAILGLPSMTAPLAGFQGLYGRTLLGKILLALLMVALAAVNRFAFLRRLGPSAAARRRFSGFVAAEGSVGLVVLFLAAVLTSSSPPYVSDTTEPIEVTGETESFHVTMLLATPPTPGAFSALEFRIVWKEDGSLLQNDTCGRPRGCILLEVVPPGAEEHDEDETDVHQGGEHRILEPRGDGWWFVPDVLFVDSGEYGLLVEIQTEYVFLDVVELHLEVGGPHDEHAGHEM